MTQEKKVPLAEPILSADESGTGPGSPQGPTELRLPQAPPPLTPCPKDLDEGCYKITFKPASVIVFGPTYQGTLRVENKSGGGKTISADLYKFSLVIVAESPIVLPPIVVAPIGVTSTMDQTDASLIPIYPRNKYYSYLRGTGYSRPPFTVTTCKITVTAEEFVYNQPPAGNFNGTFNAAPTRTVKIVVSPTAVATVFTGNLFEGTVDKGTIKLEWVSKSFRRAVVEIDTLTGAVAPKPINPGTASEQSFTKGFATAGWKMDAIYNDTNVAVPAGITATNCWSDANLHALMLAVRSAGTNLDNEWRFHLMVVPGQMNCSRGKMYDIIGAHREAVVSYSDDGYPTTDSLNFGTAANKKQRDVPLAYLRSASHELGHACNMQHQEFEGGADNSLMTTTPSVANVLGSAITGAPGVFPTNINIGFNAHCRHHLIHFPDPVVRPGGMSWMAGHPSLGGVFAPEADGGRLILSNDQVRLNIKTQNERIKLGEPLLMAWEVENLSNEDIHMPSDISRDASYAQVSITDPIGNTLAMPNFVLECEHTSIKKLSQRKPAAATNLFWSSQGFAFTTPGRHTIHLMIRWTHMGIPYGLQASKYVWIDYPVTDKDNEVAFEALDEEVGMFVALGGNAYHLKGAVERIEKIMEIEPGHRAAKAFSKFYNNTAAKDFKPFKLERENK